jgi:hypothetical protein
MKEWFFHVRHNARPETVKEILLILQGLSETNLEDILILGASRGYTIGTTAKSAQSIKENPIQVARDLGLVQQDKYALTNLGREVADLMVVKPKVVNEYLHYLHYITWSSDHPQNNCFSWSYKTLCNILWDADTLLLDRAQLADQLATIARSRFQVEDIALSQRSAEAIIKWLTDLDPTVVMEQTTGKKKDRIFRRRVFCPPEAFILAVDYVYGNNNIGYQTNMILDNAKQEEICKVCLLDPSGFESTLEWTCGQFKFIMQGFSGGWGRYLVLSRRPQIADFIG